MNLLTKALLCGAAHCALGVSPVKAQHKDFGFHVVALHAGRTVHKTSLHAHGITHQTQTVSPSYFVSADGYRKKEYLFSTFYRFESQSSFCYPNAYKPKNKLDRKRTEYAKLGTTTSSFSLGCSSGFTPYYGDTYKLVNKAGFGQKDFFKSTLTGKYKNKNGTYKGTLHLNVEVDIGRE
jgi:hypothetical protein